MKVKVLMSTYNGEKYILDQLDSIFKQKFNGNIELIIRDDGSSDKTLEIIYQYIIDKKVKIIVMEGKNIGVQRSFLNLLYKAGEADYYLFSDQDDIWLSDKINCAINKLKDYEYIPALYGGNYNVVDSNCVMIKENVINEILEFTPLKAMFYNKIPGCTMAFNRCLYNEIRKVKISNIRMHDIMVLTIATLIGKVIYDEKSYILHRIHEKNVVGYGYSKINIIKWIKEKFSLLRNGEQYDISEFAKELLNNFNNEMSIRYKDDLILVLRFKESLICKIKLLSHNDTNGKMNRNTLSIRSKILFNVF